jgi:exonuclease V gamma subunit
MLHLHFAPSLDLLVPAFLSDMHKIWLDPFEPPAVIVPSPAIGKWLTMRMADGTANAEEGQAGSFGCVANLEMCTLERYLWDALKPSDGMELLDVAHVQQIICALLENKNLQNNFYAPLRNYLAAGNNGEIDPLKRVQLSSQSPISFSSMNTTARAYGTQT